MATAEEAIQEADNPDQPFSLCYVLMSCVNVPLETGDWEKAEELIHRLSSHATTPPLYLRSGFGGLAGPPGGLAR